MTQAEFIERYEKPAIPCLIRGSMEPKQTKERWSRANLLERFGDARFKVGEDDEGYPVKVRLKYFFSYVAFPRATNNSLFGLFPSLMVVLINQFSSVQFSSVSVPPQYGRNEAPPPVPSLDVARYHHLVDADNYYLCYALPCHAIICSMLCYADGITILLKVHGRTKGRLPSLRV